jgi:diaminohydroxyphosphoribosylaminopyrimidine deaminase/5-amino-6-(5-phosphoribosylamino)uracil reductase
VSETIDQRYMAATIRYARRNISRTRTNPSVGCLIVQTDHNQSRIVGRGVTALGGRPHAEPLALLEAGENAAGATAYVTLEPCAHHGATPSCAQTLIDAGIARVVTGWVDPDYRVDGKGHVMLREAGIEVETGVLAECARDDLGGYLTRKQKNRPWVTLKLAVFKDGFIGKKGAGQVAITGAISRAQVDMMRAGHDAILVGSATAIADDPELICRQPSLKQRSPHRIILDTNAVLPVESRLVKSLNIAPLTLVVGPNPNAASIQNLETAGVNFITEELVDGRIALPELLEDLASTGISSVFVEGGAKVAEAFLEAGLVDEVDLFIGNVLIGGSGVASPVSEKSKLAGFNLVRTEYFSEDVLYVYRKEQN